MIVMCHEPAQKINKGKMSSDTIYLTTNNRTDRFNNINVIYSCGNSFHEIIKELNSICYNRTDGLDPKIYYGIFKYNVKEGNFFIIDCNRTVVYDSRVGFLDIKALSIKKEE